MCSISGDEASAPHLQKITATKLSWLYSCSKNKYLYKSQKMSNFYAFLKDTVYGISQNKMTK